MDSPRDDLTRSYAFELTRATSSTDGLTLEGYAAVFDSPAVINSAREGHFVERIKAGAFKRTLQSRTPVLMFNHGHHPLIGDMPIGTIQHAREDAKGLFIRARLASNWLIEPVREAIEQKAITGMSFRFSVPDGKEVWRDARGDELAERDILEVRCAELGPVVFPAYEDTSVGVRSAGILTSLADKQVRTDLARALVRDMNGWTLGDAQAVVADAIEDQLGVEGGMCWMVTLSDTFAVFNMMDADGENDLYQVDYTIAADGTVTLGTPIEVLQKTTYVPATSDELDEPVTSSEPGMQAPDSAPGPSGGMTPMARQRALDLLSL